ncbi:CRISPR-associated helicase Cas3' [Maribellus comscasis]|uniref:CRISPR-associated helicase Cas3 n=1 Tax=Maribellus comscasis TaxID=2681766 RepID=A0A6I6K264_9BACT|nr:CRISPR-associated helicase Cas3' [Maribellus comscasis]QGY47490.1 CRISPR-associated helicase Cas3' [Maribellus comscasis]
MKSYKKILSNPNRYFAHLAKDNEAGGAETLLEHSDLVLYYAQKVCEKYGLNLVIQRLIEKGSSESVSSEFRAVVYKLFFQSVYFHDFGKINPNFQREKMNNSSFKSSNYEFGSDHSYPGVLMFINSVLSDVIKNDELLNNERLTAVIFVFLFCQPIAKHHSPYLTTTFKFIRERLDFSVESEKLNLSQVLEILKELENIEPSEYWSIISQGDAAQNASWIIKKIEKFNRQREDNKLEAFPLFALLKLHYSLLTASDYLATTHYMNNWTTPLTDFGQMNDELRQRIIRNVQSTKSYNKKVFDNLNGFEFTYPTEPSNENLNRLRQELSVEVVQNIRNNTDKNIFYIEAPTGGGKTNLSMLAAAELLAADAEINNLYYVFPFTTLITQTYKAVKETMGLDEDEIIQLHSKEGFKEKDDQYGQEKKNHIDYLFLNYPVALLSHVRFFDILKTNGKETNYLLHRLANSIVIVDELQSYPPKIWDKLIYFIQNYARYFNIRFILMSATLPKLDKLSNVEPDICYLTNHRKQFFQNPNFCNRVLFDFSLLGWAAPEKDEKAGYLQRLANILVEKSVEYAESNNKYPGSVFTIIEFIYKKTATEFYHIVKDKADGFFDKVFVLSGTILESRRKEIIYYLKDEDNRDKKVLLITTQVVEAGVDIDMDLGFKDKSLVDSDEQLAGRINRNVNKPACKLYLFNCDNAEVLYKGDKRFQLMQGELAGKEQEILQSKDFDLMYDHVMEKIDRQNDRIYQKGFSDFQNYLKMLDFPEVDKNFQIINQKSTSVYIPVTLPVYVPGTSQMERNFSEKEMIFLVRYHITGKDDITVSGEKVFELYEHLIQQRNDDFVDGKTELKKLQGIMSQFIFSLMTRSKALEELVVGAHGEERMGIYYLSHWERDKIYNYEFGLVEREEAAIIL